MARTTTRSDTPGTLAWEALLRVRAELVPVLAARVEEATGLPLAWYDALLELERASTDLRVGDLAERVVLSRTRVSRVVAAMIEAGLVQSAPDARDGRAVRISITVRGRRALRGAAPVYLAAIEEHFTDHLGAGEAESIATGLGRVLKSLQSKGSMDPE